MFLKYVPYKRRVLGLLLRFVFFLSGFYHNNVNSGFFTDALVAKKLFSGVSSFAALFAAGE